MTRPLPQIHSEDRPDPGAGPWKMALGMAVTAVVAAVALGMVSQRLAGKGPGVIGTVVEPRAEAEATPRGTPQETRMIAFLGSPDDGVTVVDARTGAEIDRFEAGAGGFVNGFLRGSGHDRGLVGAPPETPYRLTRWQDGRLTLEDPATGTVMALEAFGQDNAAAFGDYLSTTATTATGARE